MGRWWRVRQMDALRNAELLRTFSLLLYRSDPGVFVYRFNWPYRFCSMVSTCLSKVWRSPLNNTSGEKCRNSTVIPGAFGQKRHSYLISLLSFYAASVQSFSVLLVRKWMIFSRVLAILDDVCRERRCCGRYITGINHGSDFTSSKQLGRS